jgi:hypothetical protein
LEPLCNPSSGVVQGDPRPVVTLFFSTSSRLRRGCGRALRARPRPSYHLFPAPTLHVIIGLVNRSICSLCLFVALSTLLFASPAWAKCLVPRVALDPATGAPGTRIAISGNAKLDCGFATDSAPLPESGRTISIQFRQGSRVVDLGTVEAGGDGTYSAPFAIPQDARPGPAVIAANRAEAGFTVGGAEIPNTGLDSFRLLAGALAILLLGTGLLASAHRPNRT